MANSLKIIVHDGIGPVLDIAAVVMAERVAHAVEDGAQKLVTYARANAPWSDITGAARNGLHTTVDNEGGVIVLELAHSVDYGVWLETIQEGEYAIIMPTLELLGPDIIKEASAKVVDI